MLLFADVLVTHFFFQGCLRIDHIALNFEKSVVCEVVEVNVLMHKRAIHEGREKIIVFSRRAGVHQDVVHVGLHNIGELGDSRRIWLVVEPVEAFGLCVSGMIRWVAGQRDRVPSDAGLDDRLEQGEVIWCTVSVVLLHIYFAVPIDDQHWRCINVAARCGEVQRLAVFVLCDVDTGAAICHKHTRPLDTAHACG